MAGLIDFNANCPSWKVVLGAVVWGSCHQGSSCRDSCLRRSCPDTLKVMQKKLFSVTYPVLSEQPQIRVVIKFGHDDKCTFSS